MAAIILSCYSAYEDSIIASLIEQLQLSHICVWHSPSYLDAKVSFKPKREYLAAVYKNLCKRVSSIKGCSLSNDYRQIKNEKVFVFQQLVFAVDAELSQFFGSRLHVMKPLQYVYADHIVKGWLTKSSHMSSVRLQGFFKRVQESVEEIKSNPKLKRILTKSTDTENRQAMNTQEEAALQNQLRRSHPFATSPAEAKKHLADFIKHRFPKFAQFQDAVVPSFDQLFHSKLSAPLNCGLLTVHDVMAAVIKRARHSSKSDKEMKNSLEAFLRQLIGWREYAVAYYLFVIRASSSVRDPLDRCMQAARGSFQHNRRKLKQSLWFAADYKNTPYPLVNALLQPIWEQGYAHHIVRLYILSLMVQLFIDPREIYRWMMAAFSDSLDFVMLFNVFAMGFFDRRFTRKQYLFSSQYMQQQSGGRLKREPALDNLYRYFATVYKKELVYMPAVQLCDEQAALQVIAYFTQDP